MRLDAPGMVGDDGDELAHPRRQRRKVDLRHAEAVAFDRRQQVDVVDQPGHAVQLGDADLARGRDVVGVGRIHQLEVAAHDRDRRLELVTDVVEQLPLHVDRAFEPVEHRVDRARQIGDVVVALRAEGAATGRSRVMASAASRRSRIGESRRPATNQPTNPIATSTAIAAIE